MIKSILDISHESGEIMLFPHLEIFPVVLVSARIDD